MIFDDHLDSSQRSLRDGVLLVLQGVAAAAGSQPTRGDILPMFDSARIVVRTCYILRRRSQEQ